MDRMRSLQVSPPLGQPAFHDPPDDDAAELDLVPGCFVGGAPRVSDDNFISFGDDVFDGDVNIGEPLKGRRKILLGAGRSGRQAGWYIRPVLLIVGREIAIRRGEILTV